MMVKKTARLSITETQADVAPDALLQTRTQAFLSASPRRERILRYAGDREAARDQGVHLLRQAEDVRVVALDDYLEPAREGAPQINRGAAWQ